MQAQVNSLEGKAIKKIDLPETIFGQDMNEALLHLMVKAYRANERQGTHWAKTRAYVSGGGKKPFKQKGTGEARQGSTRSPLQPGGATVHGPQPRDYRQITNKKSRQLALAVALSDRARHHKLHIIDDFKLDKYSTKHMKNVLAALKTDKTLFIDERKDDFLARSARNLQYAAAVPASEVNAKDVLGYTDIVMTESAVQVLTQRLSGQSEKPAKTPKAKAAPKAKTEKKTKAPQDKPVKKTATKKGAK